MNCPVFTNADDSDRNSSNSGCDLSVVATVYNDAGIVETLAEQVIRELEVMQLDYELILVNDGSVDDSEQVISRLSGDNPRIKGLTLSRNCGQQIAMSAGLQFAQGRFVLIMDGDLQNPPTAIPALYRKISEGYDIVYAVSGVRDNRFNEFSSKLLWFALNRIFRLRMVPNQLMMRIMTAAFVSQFNRYSENTRFVAGITHDIGMKYAVVEVENQRRVSGESHYSPFKRLSLMIDIIIGVSVAPLNAMLYLGLAVFFITLLLSAYELYVFVTQGSIPGFTSLILSMFFFNSVIIVLLGLIGKYVANIYNEVRARPLYFVKQKFNL